MLGTVAGSEREMGTGWRERVHKFWVGPFLISLKIYGKKNSKEYRIFLAFL